jgi:signal transduction histidine kinase
MERCDPLPIARAVVEAARLTAPEGVDLGVRKARAAAVASDPGHLHQVLANLVDNAVKYSPDGGRVEVALKALDTCVQICVIDEGLGIPRSEARRVFEKFYRLDPNMTRGVGGTGLGLYICRELVRRVGGRIWVEPNDRSGSTFVVELPRAHKPAVRRKTAKA